MLRVEMTFDTDNLTGWTLLRVSDIINHYAKPCFQIWKNLALILGWSFCPKKTLSQIVLPLVTFPKVLHEIAPVAISTTNCLQL
jgi:hypothetical protein